jgi:hypothetical protein
MTVLYAARLAGEHRLTSYYRTVAPVCHDGFDYWRGLHQLWTQDVVVVNLEHDHDFTDAPVVDLLACPHPLCSHAYLMHIPYEHYAHGWASDVPAFRERAQGVRWIEQGDEWADYSGIGFCKITPEARVGPLRETEWNGLEMSVNACVRGPWHLHWPSILHHHR